MKRIVCLFLFLLSCGCGNDPAIANDEAIQNFILSLLGVCIIYAIALFIKVIIDKIRGR